jgi:formate/nitrite transporter FocA (FNT family)
LKWVGAFLFSLGLFAVVTYGFNLYTGKVGYILQNDRIYLLEVLITIIGNFIGCLIMGYFFQFPLAETMVQGKIDLFFADGGLIDAIVKGVMCGVLMYIAVDVYKSKGSYLGVFICVPVFILAGFEHSIADMFYFCAAGAFNIDSLVFILVVIIGNAIGGVLIPLCRKYMYEPGTEPQ